MWDFDKIINRATILYGENEPFEIIAKYSGDIQELNSLDNVFVEVLNNTFAIITLTLENAKTILTAEQINYVEIPKKLSIVQNNGLFLDEYYREPYICPSTDSTLTGKGILVSILDTGIQYQHQDFRNSDGSTRILYIWDQSIEGTPPEGFNIGNVYTKSMIDEALASRTPLPTNDNVGHGTMVAGICVGNGNESDGLYKGVAPEANIMAVKLGTDQYASFALTTAFMRAIKYSYDMAQIENMPLVINVSYGTNAGSHQGDSLFEEYIDDMISSYPSTFVVASGNEGDAGHHYSSVLMNGETENVVFNVAGGIKELEISLWKNFVDTFSLQLISPSGEKTDVLTMSNDIYISNFNGTTISILYAPPTPYQIEQEIYINIKFDEPLSSIQKWTIVLESIEIVDGRFQMWLPTVEEVSRLTNFVNSDKHTTLTAPSTANNVITVGAYNTSTNEIADFSGRGFKPNETIKPDLVAPGVDVLTTNNLLSYDVTSGTSFSAPFVTGAAAVLMQYGIIEGNEIFLYGEKLKAYLQRGASRLPDTVYPNRDFGYGRLCLQGTLDILTTLNADQIPLEIEMSNNIEVLIEKSPILLNTLKTTTYVTPTQNLNTFNNFIIAELPQNKLDDFINKNTDLNIETAIPLSQMSTNINYTPKQNTNQRAGNGTLIAIIDYDINIFDDCFIDQYGNSKIKYYLNLEYNGKELTSKDITSMHKNNINNNKTSHGTMMAKIASSMSPGANFIIVNLKKATDNIINDYLIKKGEVFSSIDVIKALHYATTRATELNMPISIGLCLGSNFGTHSGDTIFEKYISDLSLRRGISVCVATGNEADKKTHLERTLSNNRREYFSINVCGREKDLTLSIYTDNVKNFSITISTPDSESFTYTPSSIIETYSYKYKFEDTTVNITSHLPKQQLIIKLKNTKKGIYTVSYTPYVETDSKLHAYLPISPQLSGNTFFTTPSPNFTSAIPSTAKNIISVGAYNETINSSGRGPNRNMEIRPTIVSSTPNTDSTSLATAKITGICANLLQIGIEQDIDINTPLIKSILIDLSSKDTKFNYPNNVEGYGRIDNILL